MSPSTTEPVPRPTFLGYEPCELRFGTSGLRGRVVEMTDLEVYINTRGFLAYLEQTGELRRGEPVALAEDLRETDPKSGTASSPRIAGAVARAIGDAGLEVLHCGTVPTPAVAYYAALRDKASRKRPMACVMVTGSHIPADRNGVKFYKKAGEVLKTDEAGILAAVRKIRAAEYGKAAEQSAFDGQGMLRKERTVGGRPVILRNAEAAYADRYLDLFQGQQPLTGKRIVVYQHSAVGRDLLVRLLETLGATVIAVGRSDAFVPVDTEDVTAEDEARYRRYAEEHQPDAIVSTDGDSDRPLVVDETGRFRRGDALGIVTAELVGAEFAAVPISTTDALDLHLERRAADGQAVMRLEKTRIGSPHVVKAMHEAVARGERAVVGWEANGGFLTATELSFGQGVLAPLPTRDAVLPILAVLIGSAERGVPLSALFAALPVRATRAGLLDEFSPAHAQAIVEQLRPATDVLELDFDGEPIMARRAGQLDAEPLVPADALSEQARTCRERLSQHFSPQHGFGDILRINYVDGVRIFFDNGDIAHLRPSGNAPQFRIYAVADTQQRADEIVALGVREPDGLLRQMQRQLDPAGA